MASSSRRSLLLILVLLFVAVCSEAKASRKAYVVYVDGGSDGKLATRSAHTEMLEKVVGKGRRASELLIYSYKESFPGFAARLTDEERRKLEGVEGVIAVRPSKRLRLQTTRSWDFIGFPTNVNRSQGNVESDLIIGVIDSGIWPDLDSFRDDGLGPPPSKWKGECQNITCNNKIIGARSYFSANDTLTEELSTIDLIGHGSHVASIAAGVEVRDASFYGLGRGSARGGVPSARIAVYKVCWNSQMYGYGCEDQDFAAAIDDAIQDGVDIISFSNTLEPDPYDDDVVAIATFRAMKKGILTSVAGGNAGPNKTSVTNVAPWLLTVAASSIDRKFMGEVELGSGQSLYGSTINGFQTQSSFYRLEYRNSSQINEIGNSAAGIYSGSELRRNAMEAGNANVIAYFSETNVMEVSNSTASGIIVHGDVCKDDAVAIPSLMLPIPGVCLESDLPHLNSYYNRTGNPIGKIHKSVAVFDPMAPAIAAFSGRGPNKISPDILKPDISAPGVDILAAWSPKGSPTFIYPSDKRSVKFNIVYGTSMACPHVTAAAIYVKEFHPSWSPSAIKSALMTTATPMSAKKNPEAELAYGAGQVNPVRAIDPGLVYDATDSDYVKFLCSDGYSTQKVRLITGDNTVNCPSTSSFTTKDLNYPSMSAKVAPNKTFTVEFKRTVTNVGSPSSEYKAQTDEPITGLRVDVNPPFLSFTSLGEYLNFSVVVSGGPIANGSETYASLIWTDVGGKYSVRSPILIYAL